MIRGIRLVVRLGVLAGLFWLARTAFKRWVEGPEPVPSDPQWEPTGPATQAETRPPAEPPTQPAAEPAWVKPDGAGEVPASHPVKAKVASRIYRVPGMASYEQTKADRCYPSAEAAEADGFTRAKR